jgi:hypothetical protein
MNHKKHGMSRTKLHGKWCDMRKRCTNKNNPDYKHYGERGIKVCEEWDSFENFRDWSLKNGYKDDLQIDRIDVNKGYFPENCRFVTRKENLLNRRNTVTAEINGCTKPLVEWAEIYGISRMAIRWRYNNGDRDEFLVRPPRKYCRGRV